MRLPIPRIIEVMVNPDGRLWLDELGVGMRDTGTIVPAGQAENMLGTIAATLGCVVTPERPILEGELALDGSRFCGLLPPVVLAPAFCIRKAAALRSTRWTTTCATAFLVQRRNIRPSASTLSTHRCTAGATGMRLLFVMRIAYATENILGRRRERKAVRRR